MNSINKNLVKARAARKKAFKPFAEYKKKWYTPLNLYIAGKKHPVKVKMWYCVNHGFCAVSKQGYAYGKVREEALAKLYLELDKSTEIVKINGLIFRH